MSNMTKWTTRLLIAVVAFALCGLPQMLAAQTPAQTAQPAASQSPQAAPPAADQPQAPAAQPGIVDPSKGPLQPVPSAPETPSSSDNQPQNADQANAPNAPTPNAQPQQQQPLGSAVGQAGVTTGGPASKPAGSAIAPAKQRQTRSLLIKVGAIAAGAAAIGAVVALSKGSPSNPPGAK